MSEKKDKKKDSKPKGEAKDTHHREEKKDSKNKDEDSEMEAINVQGKPVKLAPGGELLFQILALRDVNKNDKPAEWIVHLSIDDKKDRETKPKDGKTNTFDDPAVYAPMPEGTKLVTVSLHEKDLIGATFKGEVRIDAASLYDGYPNDRWYDLKNKEGKDKEGKESKIKGQLHLRLMYLSKDEKTTHNEFKYPLHHLINKNRLDIFQRKIDDLEKKCSDKDDKGLTPLLLAASEGKVAFVKVLLDSGAKPMDEKNSEGRNAVHLAAAKGAADVINLLGRTAGVDLNAPDGSELKLTALHIAAEGNKDEVVTMLCKRHADINAKNTKGDTPLTYALAVQAGAAQAVTALVKAGADIYVKNNDKLCAWEISQRKDICYSTTTRNAFMKATSVSDWREFEIAPKFKSKQRFEGKNLSQDWKTATQYTFTVKENAKVAFLVYPVARGEDYEKKAVGCIVKHDRADLQVTSFQQHGIGFAAAKPFEFNMEPENAYTICPYALEESLNGDFGIVVFTNTKEGVKGAEPKPFKTHVEADGRWKGQYAAGSIKPLDNPYYLLDVAGEGEVDVTVLLAQKSKDVSGSLFGEGSRSDQPSSSRIYFSYLRSIVPAKFYIGFFIFDKTVNKEVDKTEHWLNSFEVVKNVKLEGGKSYTLIPTTQKEGEELDFSLHAFSNAKLSLKLKKGEK